jgi:hypothetical protein
MFNKNLITLKYWLINKLLIPIYTAFVIVPQHRRIKKLVLKEYNEMKEAERSGDKERIHIASVKFNQALLKYQFPC